MLDDTPTRGYLGEMYATMRIEIVVAADRLAVGMPCRRPFSLRPCRRSLGIP